MAQPLAEPISPASPEPTAASASLLPVEATMVDTVAKCIAHVGLSQGRVSVQLACLADCGYVACRRAGRNAFYRVADPRVADLVVLARALAGDNACALQACQRIP